MKIFFAFVTKEVTKMRLLLLSCHMCVMSWGSSVDIVTKLFVGLSELAIPAGEGSSVFFRMSRPTLKSILLQGFLLGGKAAGA